MELEGIYLAILSVFSAMIHCKTDTKKLGHLVSHTTCQSNLMGLPLQTHTGFYSKDSEEDLTRKSWVQILSFFQDSISSPGWAVLQTTRTVGKNLGNTISEEEENWQSARRAETNVRKLKLRICDKIN